MTDHRDFKRRVRDRQARTGESYMTARRHVLAQRPQPEPEPAIAVVEVLDATADAERLGFKCRVLVFPRLAAKVETEPLLAKVRDALLLTDGDDSTELLRRLAFAGIPPKMPTRWMADLVAARRFAARARAGIGGTTNDGYVLAMHMAGRDGVVAAVMATAWHMVASRPPTIVLTTIDDAGVELWGREPWSLRP